MDLSTTTNLSYRKQCALLRSSGVRVGGQSACCPPTPSLGGLCPPAPPPMFAAFENMFSNIKCLAHPFFDRDLWCSGAYIIEKKQLMRTLWICGKCNHAVGTPTHGQYRPASRGFDKKHCTVIPTTTTMMNLISRPNLQTFTPARGKSCALRR